MGQNICKQNDWQRINLQNIQSAHAMPYYNNKEPNQKWADLYMHVSKKTYRWPKSTWKDVQHHCLPEKRKSKVQCGITSHQSEWPSSKNLQTRNAGEALEKEPSYPADGNVIWYSHHGEEYGGSLKN